MIISYVIGFLAAFVAYAFYNSKCKVGEEVNMTHAVITSLVWPIALVGVVLVILWNGLEKIFKSISKK
jgi:TRAP-type mannitol/chloroaromatic compound transport system permease small subunit